MHPGYDNKRDPLYFQFCKIVICRHQVYMDNLPQISIEALLVSIHVKSGTNSKILPTYMVCERSHISFSEGTCNVWVTLEPILNMTSSPMCHTCSLVLYRCCMCTELFHTGKEKGCGCCTWIWSWVAATWSSSSCSNCLCRLWILWYRAPGSHF